jgi:transcriptional regulator with XRE-family HTH domain
MPAREGPIGRARGRSRAQLVAVGLDLRTARIQHSLALAEIGRVAGLSAAQVSRIERGLVQRLDVAAAATLCAAVGLDLSIRTFPAGEPIRDAAHLALLERLRRRLHRHVRWRTEVPLLPAVDRRAWDAVVTVQARSIGVEAETRLRDMQALDRRLALKMRDGGIDTVILLLADTRTNRRLVRALEPALVTTFPVPGRRALELLAAGIHPGGSAIVLL